MEAEDVPVDRRTGAIVEEPEEEFAENVLERPCTPLKAAARPALAGHGAGMPGTPFGKGETKSLALPNGESKPEDFCTPPRRAYRTPVRRPQNSATQPVPSSTEEVEAEEKVAELPEENETEENGEESRLLRSLRNQLINEQENVKAYEEECTRITEQGKMLYFSFLAKSNRLKDVTARFEKLKEECEQKDATIAALQSQSDADTVKANEWKQKYMAQAERFKQNFECYKNLKQEHEALLSRMNGVSSDYEALQSKYTAVQTEVETLRNTQPVLQPLEELRPSQEEFEELRLKLQQAEEAHNKQVAMLSLDKEKLVADTKEKEDRIKQLEERLINHTSKGASSSCASEQNLEERLESASISNDLLREENTSLQNKLQGLEEAKARLQSSLVEHEMLLKQLQTCLTQKDADLSALEAKMVSIREEEQQKFQERETQYLQLYEQVKQELHALGEREQLNQDSNKALQAQLENNRAETEKVQQDLAKALDHVQSLEAQLKQQNALNKKLQSDLRLAYRRHKKELSTVKDELKHEDYKRTIASLAEEKQRLSGRLTLLQNVLDKATLLANTHNQAALAVKEQCHILGKQREMLQEHRGRCEACLHTALQRVDNQIQRRRSLATQLTHKHNKHVRDITNRQSVILEKAWHSRQQLALQKKELTARVQSLSIECQQAKQKSEQLLEQYKAEHSALSQLQVKCEHLQEEVTQSRQLLDQETATLEELKQLHASLEQQQRELESILQLREQGEQDALEQVQRLEVDKDSLVAERDELQQQKNRLEEKSSGLEESLAKTESQLRDREEALTSLRVALEQKTQELTSMTAKVQQRESELSALEQQCNQCRTELKNTTLLLREKENGLRHAESQLAKTKQGILECEEELVQCRETISFQEQEHALSLVQVNHYKAALSLLSKRIHCTEEAMQCLSAKHQAIECELEEARSSLSTKSKDLAESQQQLEELQQQLVMQAKEAEENTKVLLEEHQKQKEEELSCLRKAHEEQLQTAETKHSLTLENTQTDLSSRHREEMEKVIAEWDERQKELLCQQAETEIQFQQQLTEKQEEIARISDQVSSLQKLIEQKEAALMAQRQSLESEQSKNTTLSQEKDVLVDELTSVKEELASAKSKLSLLDERCSQRDHQLEELNTAHLHLSHLLQTTESELSAKLERAEESRRQLEAQLSHTDERVHQHELSLQQYRQEEERLRLELDHANECLKRLPAMKQMMARAKEEAERLKKGQSEAQNQISVLEEQLRATNLKMQLCENQKSELLLQMDIWLLEADRRGDINNPSAERQKLLAEKFALERQVSALNIQLAAARKEVRRQSQELDLLRNYMNEYVASFERKVKLLQQNLESAEEESSAYYDLLARIRLMVRSETLTGGSKACLLIRELLAEASSGASSPLNQGEDEKSSSSSAGNKTAKSEEEEVTTEELTEEVRAQELQGQVHSQLRQLKSQYKDLLQPSSQ
ncbi:hypothetical protein QOT17_010235 [Balamuthia mandrillaris]